MHSGKDGHRLLELTGETAGEGFGTSNSNAGDVDGDGHADLIVGAWQLRGRTSVIPGGHCSPGWICVPPRPCPPWACARAGRVNSEATTGTKRTKRPNTGRMTESTRVRAGNLYPRARPRDP